MTHLHEVPQSAMHAYEFVSKIPHTERSKHITRSLWLR